MAKQRFERHKQPWTGEEAGQLRTLAAKGKGLKEIAKALNRSEESTKTFAKQNKIYWIVPLVVVLLLAGLLVVTSQGAAPFIYTLF